MLGEDARDPRGRALPRQGVLEVLSDECEPESGALGAAVQCLREAGFPSARDDARALRAAAGTPGRFAELVERRAAGEPLEWLVGWAPFAGHRILVSPGVYVPRRQSEELARRAVGHLPPAGVAVDLCTGSGAIAMHLVRHRPRAVVAACDVDPRAAECAARNGVATVVGDLDAPFASGCADVVCAVAPYVPRDALPFLPRDVLAFEPLMALDGGSDGLDVVRRVVLGASRVLRAGGWLLTEIGGNQDDALADHLAAVGFVAVARWVDDEGDVRGVEACRP